jgi:hypothetical protein
MVFALMQLAVDRGVGHHDMAGRVWRDFRSYKVWHKAHGHKHMAKLALCKLNAQVSLRKRRQRTAAAPIESIRSPAGLGRRTVMGACSACVSIGRWCFNKVLKSSCYGHNADRSRDGFPRFVCVLPVFQRNDVINLDFESDQMFRMKRHALRVLA